MSYNGYRIKINGDIVPNAMISRGTYSIKKENRIIDSYEDADFVLHEVVSDDTRTTISFSFREHDSSDHEDFREFTIWKDKIEVNYYDDELDTYKTGLFKMDSVSYSHRNVIGNKIFYNATQVKLTEY